MILNFSPNSLTCFFTCHSFSFKNLIPKIQNPIKFSKNIIFILSESCQGVTVTCHQNKTTLRHFRIVWSFSNLKRSPCRFLLFFLANFIYKIIVQESSSFQKTPELIWIQGTSYLFLFFISQGPGCQFSIQSCSLQSLGSQGHRDLRFGCNSEFHLPFDYVLVRYFDLLPGFPQRFNNLDAHPAA